MWRAGACAAARPVLIGERAPRAQARGAEALAALRRSREEAAAAEDLRAAAERRLRLRRLGRGAGLPLRRFRAAVLRLLHNADALQARRSRSPPACHAPPCVHP